MCLLLGTTAPVFAQQNPAANEFLDSMLRSLIEGQSNQRQPPREERRRGDARVRATPEVRELRANLGGFSQAVSQLVAILYRDVSRTPGVRPLMGEALQLNAKATLAARRSASQSDVNAIAADFEEVDQKWRLLSFRLSELRGLSRAAETQIRTANEFHSRITRQLDIDPQMDRNAIVRQASALATEITRLLEEIDHEVFDGDLRYRLLLEGRRVFQQARRVSTVAGRASIEDTRIEYTSFRENWKPFAARVRPLNLSFVDRQLQRVQAADRELQELLMVHTDVDRAELLYLTELLQRDLDGLMDGISLRDLTRLTGGRDQIIDRASEFYSACGDFAECVRSGETDETMADLYDYLDQNWRQVAGVLRRTETPKARQVYRQLERSIGEIREVLSVGQNEDPSRMIEVAANLENLAAHLEHDIRSIFAARPNNFDRQFRTQSMQLAQNFKALANRLHADLVAGRSPQQIRETIVLLSRRWNNLQPVIDRLPRQDRDHLLTVRRQVPPVLVELQTMLTL